MLGYIDISVCTVCTDSLSDRYVSFVSSNMINLDIKTDVKLFIIVTK